MPRFRHFRQPSIFLAVGSLLTIGLSGCAAVDAFGPRVDEYNDQAANSKASMILKNVLRAAYHLPLQFSDISGVSGTATSSIGMTASVPIIGTGSSLSPTGSIGGGPTFTFANLNTQEFYNGIQTPVSLNFIQTLLTSRSVSPYILYPLVISDLEYSSDGKQRIVWHSGASPASFQNFVQVLNGFIAAGMSTETLDDNAQVGPDLGSNVISNPEFMGRVGAALVSTTDVKVLLQKKQPSRDYSIANMPLSGPTYAFVKKGSRVRVCFDPDKIDLYMRGQNRQVEMVSGPLKHPERVLVKFKPEAGLKYLTLDKGNWCRQNDLLPKQKGLGYLNINLRSVEGIIEYLGQLASTELGLETGTPEALGIDAYQGGDRVSVFKVSVGQKGPDDITTLFNSQIYSVAQDSTGRDYSTQALQLLTDLIALESSAKSFPAPSVVTLVP